jgi:NADH/NAD ratio-sensing transcriptional regulator Rex
MAVHAADGVQVRVANSDRSRTFDQTDVTEICVVGAGGLNAALTNSAKERQET